MVKLKLIMDSLGLVSVSLLLTVTVPQSLLPSVSAQVETLPVVKLEPWNSPAPDPAFVTTRTRTGRIQAVYDQNDTIYILTPTPNGNGVKILPYSISNDSYESPVTTWIIAQPKMEGSAVWGRGGGGGPGASDSDTIYYLEGGLGQPSKVWKFTLSWRRPARYYEVKQLGTLEESHPTEGSIVSDGAEYVYIIGGVNFRNAAAPSDKIYRISMRTDHIDEVVRMPLPRADVKAVYDNSSGNGTGSGDIFIFSGLLPVLKYDTASGNFESFTLQPPPRSPALVDGALKQVVWVQARSFALLFHCGGPMDPAGGGGGWIVTKWSPLSEELQPIELKLKLRDEPSESEPFVNENYTAVYVEKLDRVYIFGHGDGKEEATAYYIDLSQASSNEAPRRLHSLGTLLPWAAVAASICAILL